MALKKNNMKKKRILLFRNNNSLASSALWLICMPRFFLLVNKHNKLLCGNKYEYIQK